jgi:hypothetical protein
LTHLAVFPQDEDDEVRDRVTVFLAVLDKEDAAFLLDPLPMPFANLERSVRSYQHHLAASQGKPLTFAALPIVVSTHEPYGVVIEDRLWKAVPWYAGRCV